MKRRGEREGVEKDIEESDEEGVGADQDGKMDVSTQRK